MGNILAKAVVCDVRDKEIMRILAFVGSVMVLALAAVAGSIVYSRLQARMLLESVADLDLGNDSSSFTAFGENHRHQLASKKCLGDTCQYEFVVNNWPFSVFQLGPPAELRARITVFHGKLDAVGIDYSSKILKENSLVVHVQEDFCADRTDIRCDHFALNPHGRDMVPAWNGNIEFGQLATHEQKDAAWALNLNCFTFRHGCKDISQLSPKIWKATAPGSVSSRMRSTSDSIAEASQPLSD
jgi:hypothetical protein